MGDSNIVVIGQFPPPITGFSYITDKMSAALKQRLNVSVCNIAAPLYKNGLYKHAYRFTNTMKACMRLIALAWRGRRVCYIACEGGLGIIYTLLCVIVARLLGYRIYLHHHSFAYIDKPRRLMQAVLFVGGEIIHIFLCHTMCTKYQATYRRAVRSTVISNICFVPVDEVEPLGRCDDTLVLGHLSNLTREKGLYVFLDLLRQAISSGKSVRGVLAGPAALEEDQAAIAAAVVEMNGKLDYRGPLYGEQKAAFYRDVDLFVFPTQYVNEAQPTVLFEAQAAGCRVLAYDRGCIPSQVGELGLRVSPTEDFVTEALAWIDSGVVMTGRAEQKAIFNQNRAQARAALHDLVLSAADFAPGDSQ